MMSLAIEQLQTNFDQAIDFVQTGKSLTVTQDGQSAAILFSFKKGSEELRLRHAAQLEGFLAPTVKEYPTGRVRAVCGRHK